MPAPLGVSFSMPLEKRASLMPLVDVGVVQHAVRDVAVDAAVHDGWRQVLPVADMAGEEDGGLAAVADGVEAFGVHDFDASAFVRMHLAEMGHLAGDVTERGPGAVGDFLELLLAGLRERHAKVAHHGLVGAGKRTKAAQHSGAKVGGSLDRHRLQREPVDPVPQEDFEAPHRALAEGRRGCRCPSGGCSAFPRGRFSLRSSWGDPREQGVEGGFVFELRFDRGAQDCLLHVGAAGARDPCPW